MGKSSRRRFTATAAIVAASAPFVASLSSLDSGAASAPTPNPNVATTTSHAASVAEPASALGSSDEASPPPAKRPLTTAFSCGATWRDARSCGVPCVDGNDEGCPSGQRCYAGIPCELEGESSESLMEQVLERQDRLERQEVDRLQRERDEEYVGRFVCGTSYEEAESSCNASPSSASPPLTGLTDGVEGAHYCPAGTSSQCPTNTECYAAVPCPRHSHAEEPPLMIEIDEESLWPTSYVVTEPILLNFTFEDSADNSGFEDRSATSLEDLIGSSPALEGRLSALLSSSAGGDKEVPRGLPSRSYLID